MKNLTWIELVIIIATLVETVVSFFTMPLGHFFTVASMFIIIVALIAGVAIDRRKQNATQDSNGKE